MTRYVTRCIVWALASIAAKLLLRHFAIDGGSFLREAATPLLNTAVFAACGIIFLADPSDKNSRASQGGAGLLVLLLALHAAVFLSTYVGDYFEWTHRIAQRQGIAWEKAGSLLDQSLQAQGHGSGLAGYFHLLITTPVKAIDPNDIPDELPEIILWAIPKALQRLVRLVGWRVEGLIEMLYWYVLSWVLAVSTGRFLHYG
jgi:hypothetical protein